MRAANTENESTEHPSDALDEELAEAIRKRLTIETDQRWETVRTTTAEGVWQTELGPVTVRMVAVLGDWGVTFVAVSELKSEPEGSGQPIRRTESEDFECDDWPHDANEKAKNAINSHWPTARSQTLREVLNTMPVGLLEAIDQTDTFSEAAGEWLAEAK